MLLRIFNDDSPLVDHSQQIKQAKQAQADSESPAEMDGADDDGGVKLEADADEDMDDAKPVPVEAGVMSIEADAMAKEDRLKADQQSAADEEQAVAAAPEREGEDDTFNKTV